MRGDDQPEQSGVEHTHGFTRAGRARPRPRGILRARIQGPRRAGLRRALVATAAVTTLLTGCAAPAGAPPAAASARADAVLKIVRDTMAAAHLKAVLVRVKVGGEEVLTRALGESMTGVPASTTMHFRNGAVAISYVATLLLRLVDQNKVSLDDKLAKWLPDVPNADRVTLGQLAQMTSGYPITCSATPSSRRPSWPTRSGSGRRSSC